jgi:anti-anti-sigma regulatory factor
MLRITVVEASRSAVSLRVEGRIVSSWVEELRKTCDAHSSNDDEVQLSLELADVSFIDGDGIVLLKKLRTRGVSLLHVNPYLAEQLKDGTPSDRI